MEDLPPEAWGKEEEPIASVPKDSKELGRMKWQLKRKAENEVEKAFLKEALKRNKDRFGCGNGPETTSKSDPKTEICLQGV